MSAADVADSVSHWPYVPTLNTALFSVGCGVFVGLEREHHGKAGASNLWLGRVAGLPRGLSGMGLYPCDGLLGVLVCFLNLRQLTLSSTLALRHRQRFIVGFAGVFSGQGHTFTPVAVLSLQLRCSRGNSHSAASPSD